MLLNVNATGEPGISVSLVVAPSATTSWSYGSSWAPPSDATARTTWRSTSTRSTVASTKRARRRAGRMGCAQCRSSSRPEHASNRSGVSTKKFSRLTSVISAPAWGRHMRSRWRVAVTPANPPPSTTMRVVPAAGASGRRGNSAGSVAICAEGIRDAAVGRRSSTRLLIYAPPGSQNGHARREKNNLAQRGRRLGPRRPGP